MKRDEDAIVRPPGGELETASFEDPAVSLAGVRVTRARAIKLAGAALASSVLGMVVADDADARRKKKRKNKKKKKRRNRRPGNFGSTPVGKSVTENVPITNSGPEPAFVSPDLGNPSFALSPTFDPSVAVAPGSTVTVPITFTPATPGVQTGSVTLVDADGNEVRSAPLTGRGT